MFRKIPPQTFKEFHARIEGEGWWWEICSACGGQCEHNMMGSLMPGEKEFITGWLGAPVPEFEEEYPDKVVTPYGAVDILSLDNSTCPFLSSDFRCRVKPVKVVMCEVYPVIFEVSDGKVVYFVDSLCPLARHKEIKGYFEKTVIPALAELAPPVEWCEALALYDHFDYDYEALRKGRKAGGKYQSFSLEQLLAKRLDR